MPQLLLTIGIRLLVCAFVAWLFWRWKGPFGLVFAAPLWGVAFAKPVLDVLSTLRHTAKAMAYASTEGRHFEHHGHAIDIVDDEDHHRWLSTADVRKVIPGLPREAVLQRQFPAGVRDDRSRKGHRIDAEALISYLSKSTDSDTLRFRNWLEREVARPAAITRRRLGIDPSPPAPSAGATTNRDAAA